MPMRTSPYTGVALAPLDIPSIDPNNYPGGSGEGFAGYSSLINGDAGNVNQGAVRQVFYDTGMHRIKPGQLIDPTIQASGGDTGDNPYDRTNYAGNPQVQINPGNVRPVGISPFSGPISGGGSAIIPPVMPGVSGVAGGTTVTPTAEAWDVNGNPIQGGVQGTAGATITPGSQGVQGSAQGNPQLSNQQLTQAFVNTNPAYNNPAAIRAIQNGATLGQLNSQTLSSRLENAAVMADQARPGAVNKYDRDREYNLPGTIEPSFGTKAGPTTSAILQNATPQQKQNILQSLFHGTQFNNYAKNLPIASLGTFTGPFPGQT